MFVNADSMYLSVGLFIYFRNHAKRSGPRGATARKQNLTQNSHPRSFKLTYFGISGKPTMDSVSFAVFELRARTRSDGQTDGRARRIMRPIGRPRIQLNCKQPRSNPYDGYILYFLQFLYQRFPGSINVYTGHHSMIIGKECVKIFLNITLLLIYPRTFWRML